MTTPYVEAGFPQETESVSGEPRDSDPIDRKDAGGESIKSVRKGFWLDGEPEKVAKDIDAKWNAQNKGQKTGLARGELNEKRRQGDAYSKLVKDTDADTYRIYTPRGVEQAPPSLNKTDDLSVKVVANIYADPPRPECEPSSDNDDDRSAAEFSTRVLLNESTEAGMNIPDLIWDAEDAACSWGSGFVYAYVDPQGGGHRPREVMAPKDATMVGPNGQPVDGTTEPELRYVAADGVTITDEPSEAMLEWLPRVCGEILTRRNLRFLPETCTGIRDAEGVLIAAFEQLGELKAKFPAVAKMAPDDLRKLVSYRPEVAKLLLPKHAGTGEGTKSPDHDSSKGPPDDALCLTLTGYMRGSGKYPLGAYVCMGGENKLLHRQTWDETVPDQHGRKFQRAMDVPVAQFRQFKDTRTNDPHGRGLVDRVGDGDPLVHAAIGSIIEYLQRIGNPHQFVPIGSGIQAKSIALPRGTPIPFNPAGGGIPVQEKIEPLSPEFMKFIEFVRADQDSVAGLQQAAQGVASASVQSGRHAQQIIEQALVALGGVKQGADSGYMRLCRVVLQLIRKFYTPAMRIKIVGEDGAFKEKEWTGADLGSTIDVKIQAGTSTMMSASAKSMIALEKLQVGAITPEDYQRAEEGNVHALLGRQDNPHRTRVASQIAAWNDGPPDDWAPPQPQLDPATNQPVVDPQTGQPIVLADPTNPFADRRAVDFVPDVALVRYQQLARANSSTKYATKPPEWRVYFDQEFEAMRQAANVQTVQEQQQAAQQQVQQPQAMAAQEQEAERQRVEQESVAKAQEAEAQRVASEQSEMAKQQQTLSMEEFKAAKAMELEEARHRMAMEAKQMDMALQSEMAQRQAVGGDAAPVSAPASGGGGLQLVLPAEIGPLQDSVAQTGQSIQEIQAMIQNLEQAMIALAEHATREPPPPVVNVPAPIVHVEAPVVNVPAPVVNVPRPPRPQVTVEAPAQPKKKRGTITGPDGQTYTCESEVVE